MECLRENLKLFEWEPDANGERQWVLHDPLHNKFFYLDFSAYTLLKKIPSLDTKLLSYLVNTPVSGNKTEMDELHAFIRFLKSNGLIRSSEVEPDNVLGTVGSKSHKFLLKWIEAYISFTVPILSPDDFLTKTLPKLELFFTKKFLVISFLIGVAGLLLATRDMQSLIEQTRSTFSLSNLPIFFVAVIISKLVHEFSHAYVAKLQGARVPIMGIKFIVLFPLPYTDTSDTWRIYSHGGRRNVAIAGVVSELVLAAWATFLWNFAPNETLGNIFFILAASTWISSVAINAIPFMRFDGYFVLMDLVKMPNLHTRAGAFGKWFIREAFLAIGASPPENGSKRKYTWLILFAYISWIYRFSVFLTIALVVYHFFIKIFGILMFIIEIWVFILNPIISELRQWYKIRKAFMLRLHNLISISVLGIALAYLFYPIQKTYYLPGILAKGSTTPIYSEMSGQISSVFLKDGSPVSKGDPIFTLINSEIAHEYEQAILQLQAAYLQYGNSQLGTDPHTTIERSSMLLDEQSILLEAQRRSEALTIYVPNDADSIELANQYAAGDLVSEGELIGWIHSGEDWHVSLDVPNELRSEIKVGTTVSFIPVSSPTYRFSGQITHLSEIPSLTVSNWELRDLLQDQLAPQAKSRVLEYMTPHFPVRIEVPDLDGLFQTVVLADFKGARESLALGIYKKVYNILVREFDF